jgi:beta-lactamase class C
MRYRFFSPCILIIIVFYSCFDINSPSSIKTVQENLEVDTSPEAMAIKKYAGIFKTEFDSNKTVGASLAIIYNGKVVFLKNYGVKIVGTTDSVDEHTIFRLASVSKGFAGVLACLLEQDSILSLNDKIIDFLPGFKLRDSLNSGKLSIKHLLSHTSGLVPHAFDNLIEEGVPYSVILDELPTVEISAPPGQLYSYQNVIFSLLDTIAYLKTGKRYGFLIEKNIFRPLRMRNASVGAGVFLKKHQNVAMPHIWDGSRYVTLMPNEGYYNLLPAAGVNASIIDMCKWMIALMGYKKDVLNKDILKKIETPLVETPLKRSYTQSWGRIEKKEYSLGWRIYTYKGRKIIYHGGFVTGYKAEIAFCPEDKVGLVFLENSPNQLASMCVPGFFNIWFERNLPEKEKKKLPVFKPEKNSTAD